MNYSVVFLTFIVVLGTFLLLTPSQSNRRRRSTKSSSKTIVAIAGIMGVMLVGYVVWSVLFPSNPKVKTTPPPVPVAASMGRMTDSSVVPQQESFQFEVSPEQECCPWQYQPIRFEYTSDIDMDRRPCFLDSNDYRHVNRNYVVQS